LGILRKDAAMPKLLQTLATLLIALALLAPLGSRSHAAERDVLVVIVAQAAGVTDISLIALRRAFRGESAQYPGGKRVIPFNQSVGSAERAGFDRAVLGLQPSEVGRFWITRRIRDEGLPPRTLPSVEVGQRVVAAYPGALTYVRSSMVDRNVRVLTIDGVAPEQPGYALPNL
jgi:hypothetical protein